jgi:hypothetical protein
MKDRTHLLLVALMALAVGLAFLREPGFGDDLTYWTQGLEVHERGAKAWERGSFHDLRWPVWGVCWALQRVLGFGIASFYGEPLLYLTIGAMLAFMLGRKLLDSPAAGWAGAAAFLFHPLLDSICFRPMPDLSEGVLGAAAIATWWGLMHTVLGQRAVGWMIATGLLVFVAQANRVTGAFIVPVLIVNTLAFFPRRFGWLVGAGAVSVACYAGEAALYHSLFGDWFHSINANMNNAGNKGTDPVPLWWLPLRFLDAFWKGNNLASAYSVLALIGIPHAWRRLGVAGRVLVLWFVVLYLCYSSAPQPMWPIRPLLRDADRFLAALAVPMSLLAVCGLWWLWEKLNAWRPIRAPAAAVGCVAVLALWAITTRERFDLGFVPEFRSYLRSLPAGTKVFTHESMRAIALLCDADAVRRLKISAPNYILQSTPMLESEAAQATEFWYARKLVWLTMRKQLEQGAHPRQPRLGSYFDAPEREWTPVRLLAKGDTPDLIFYRRRTPQTLPPQVVGADAQEFRGLLPPLPIEWKRGSGPTEFQIKWPVPESVRGKFARLEGIAASAQPEAFTLRLKFRRGDDEVAEYLLKPYLHREGGKEFFVFSIPRDAERCDVTLKFNSKAKAARFENMRAIFETPPSP